MDQATVEHLEKQMQQTDVRMDQLALQVGDIEKSFADENGEVEVDKLLQSVNEVRNNYQHLRKEIAEVQDLQRQLSSSLQVQLRAMQSKFNRLKEKIHTKAPEPSLSASVASSLNHMHQFQHLQESSSSAASSPAAIRTPPPAPPQQAMQPPVQQQQQQQQQQNVIHQLQQLHNAQRSAQLQQQQQQQPMNVLSVDDYQYAYQYYYPPAQPIGGYPPHHYYYPQQPPMEMAAGRERHVMAVPPMQALPNLLMDVAPVEQRLFRPY